MKMHSKVFSKKTRIPGEAKVNESLTGENRPITKRNLRRLATKKPKAR